MTRITVPLFLLLLALPTPALSAPDQLTFDSAVQSIRGQIEPAEARPGQTVTYKLIVELTPGHLTYPTVQPDQRERDSKNVIELPAPADLIFVEPVRDPGGAATKPGDKGTLSYYPDGATWEFKAVVSPTASPGPRKVALKRFRVLVCDKDRCLAPKAVPVEATLVVSGTPVPIEEKYRDKVDQLLAPAAPPSPKSAGPPPSAPPKSRGPKDPPTPLPTPSPVETGKAGPPPTAVTPDTADPATDTGAKAGGRRLSADHDHEADLKAVLNQLPPPGRKQIGFWVFIATAAFWGFITLLTPCVFPMIPITVTIFIKQGEKQGGNVLSLALTYAFTIVVLLSVAALTLLTTFSRLAVNPVTNVLLGALFVVLALSLFGLFELTLPSSLSTALDNKAAQGGYIGTIFMAASFTVVSFTCVAPFLGGFSLMATSGEFSTAELAAGALVFAAAFASPFFLLALFPSALKKIPRSGDWMNMIKVAMGFLELAAALKFFRTAELRWLTPPQYFTYDLVLGLWVAILGAMGLYLLGVFRMKHDHEMHDHVGPFRILFALLALGLAVYLTPALFGTGPHERNRPRGTVYAWVDSFLLPEPSAAEVVGGDLRWSADLKGTLDDARAKGGRVFVDFTGVTCTNCKLNEREVFTKPEVKELFKKYSLVQMYTDTIPEVFYETDPGLTRRNADADANLEFEKKAFGEEQLPLYVILKPEPNGKTTVLGIYDEGKINNEPAFIDFLRKGLQ
ncbi:MAG TPA: cytochrome c biogenesis protein CcdA [Gemmataceae bacterium]|nr:cytochrome c biogenesis protein CcdA [Gemmataceae bacterium]